MTASMIVEPKPLDAPLIQEIAERIPGAQLVVVKNASHTVPEEQSEEFTRLALDFLDQVLAGMGRRQ